MTEEKIPLVANFNVLGQIICQHIMATKNKKIRHKHACQMVEGLCIKLDEFANKIDKVHKEVCNG